MFYSFSSYSEESLVDLFDQPPKRIIDTAGEPYEFGVIGLTYVFGGDLGGIMDDGKTHFERK